MKNFFYLFLFLSLFSNTAYSESGTATEYKVTIKNVELCETGSTVSDCLNPITIFTGDSGLIDIANTAAGATAAGLGDPTAAKLGTTYSVIQTTLSRKITIKGYVAVGDNSCSTVDDTTNATKVKNGKGAHAADGTPTATEAGVYYAGEALAADLNVGDAWNGITSAGVVDTTDDANDGTDIVDFQWRETLTTPITITLGKIPSVQIAFGVKDTIGFAGNIASAVTCTGAANATTGLYIKEPDISITIQN